MKAILLVFALLLSGCATRQAGPEGSGAVSTAVIPPTTAAPPTASLDAGSIDVTVVTDELVPVTQALIVLVGTERQAFTDEAGKATFNGIEPGDYTLVASKPGYETVQERGLLVKVVAGEIATPRFMFNPIVVVTADSAYHRVIPIQGFIACSINLGLTGNLNQCGKGVRVGSNTYGTDPNDNSTHEYPIEGSQIAQIHAEMSWKPANEALSSHLRFWNYPSSYIPADTSLGPSYRSPFGGASGTSPLRWSLTEGADANISKALAEEAKSIGKPTPFPRTFGVFVEPVITRIADGVNIGYSVTYQQRYDLFMTVFYGVEGPAGYSALAPA